MAEPDSSCPAWLRAAVSEIKCLPEARPKRDSLAVYIALGLGYVERTALEGATRERMLDAFTKYDFGDGHLIQFEKILSPDGGAAFKFTPAVPESAPEPAGGSNRGHGKKIERLTQWGVGLDVQKMMNGIDLSDVQSYPLPLYVLTFAANGGDLLQEKNVKLVVDACAPYFAAIVGPNPSPFQKRAIQSRLKTTFGGFKQVKPKGWVEGGDYVDEDVAEVSAAARCGPARARRRPCYCSTLTPSGPTRAQRLASSCSVIWWRAGAPQS